MATSELTHGVPAGDIDDSPLDSDSSAFIVSLVVHLALLVSLGLTPVLFQENKPALTITVPLTEQPEEITLPEQFYFSELPTSQVGANSVGDAGMALSTAPEVADVSEIPSVVEPNTTEIADIEVNVSVTVPRGLHFDSLPVRGVAGEGTTGAEGAVDRLTQEILLSMEERKTLVVWLFDQSPSVLPTRQTILNRFDRIYEELGVIEAAENPAFKKHDDKPLLTAIMSFGEKVKLVTEKPTDNLTEIKKAVATLEEDNSGIERIFSAIYLAAEKFRSYRIEGGRNVMIIAFTDEVGDDQSEGLDKTVNICRRNQIPVYIVGSPAPFGQDETMLKWVDPNPDYDQSVSWGVVSQGPESFFPERLKLGPVSGSEREPIDSGFGPYALTRLCYETGGIYFAVHPNRNVNRAVSRQETAEYSAHLKYFFDPVVMRKYRPDYVSIDEYKRRVSQNKARAALLEAARRSSIERLAAPQLEFVKRSEPALAADMSEAQKGAAKLEPVINSLYEVLKLGESDREKDLSPRWQAGYDLAIGQILAIKIRTESYNQMLAAAKRGMKFKDEKNNTWVLEPSNEIAAGSQTQKLAERARAYLERVQKDHPDTPWALLAKEELEQPLSWKWTEKFTDLSPPARENPNNNNAPPRDDAKKMMKTLPKRDLKRL